MPLDPSIFGLANKPTVALQDPGEIMAKVLQLKNMQGQGQLQGMQIQQQQQQMQDAANMRADIAAANGDPEALKAALLKRGRVKEYHEMNTAERQAKEAQYKEFKAKNDTILSLNDQQVRTMMAARDAIAKDPASAQAVWADTRARLISNATPYAPILGIDTSKTDDPEQFPGLEFLDRKIKQNMTIPDQLKAKEMAMFGGWHPAVGPNGPGIFQENKQGEVRQIPGLKPVPPAKMAGMGGVPANPNSMAGSAQERLAGVPADKRALVRAVGTYQMLTTQLSPRQKNEIMGYVAQVFPNYNIGDADAAHKLIVDLAAGGPASAGGIVGASERLLGHIGEAAALTDKLGNSSFGKLGNAVGQGFSTMTGTGNAGDVKSFELVKGKVIAELSKLVNGGVPEAKQLADDVKNLTASDPPEVKYKVLQAAASVGLEQTHALEARRNNLLGEFAPQNSLLSPRAQEVVKKIWNKAGAGDPGLAAPTTGSGYTTTAQNKETMGGVQTKAPVRVSPEEAKKLPSGTHFIGLDGVERVKH